MSSTDAVLEKAECPKCGVDVRPDSTFCYNCGGLVLDDLAVGIDRLKKVDVSAPVEKTTTPTPGLRTAREIRRRERVFDRKPKEVVWEPSATGPDTQLIVVTVIIILFTITVILLAFYLR